MIRLKFKCPTCGKPYSVKAPSQQALSTRIFNCPNCRQATPYSMLIDKAKAPAAATPPPLHTYIGHSDAGNNAAPTAKTRFSQTTPVVLALDNGRRIPVAAGQHVLGRDSADSPATIRVAPDIYMSRTHARMTVQADGTGAVRCFITPLRTANPIIVNSRTLAENETTALANGDKVLLGMTIFTVEITK